MHSSHLWKILKKETVNLKVIKSYYSILHMKKLVIVESPTKAKTIRKFLPAEYQVEASVGHIRDLPQSADEIPENIKKEKWARLGVNVNSGFKPIYVVSKDKKSKITELKKLLKDADELFIATDEDREGEAIGWHLLEVLKPKVPVKRMVFHEITKSAILDALKHTREIDQNLVDAQETRRILDRLVGYTLSPLLWRKIAPKLSAGRVQSVAVRLLVMREKERLNFVAASYWDLKADLFKDKSFQAELTHVAQKKVASGQDFDESTGKLKKGKDVLLLGKADAIALAERLQSEKWQVKKVEEKPQLRKPYPPFTTSTLQQEANRKLRFTAKHTMRVAQSLYEKGLITYMRTDSVNLSKEAIDAARATVLDRYGNLYLSPEARIFKSKSKNAQEAHEAIRPAGTEMKTVHELGLGGDEAALYDLIWKRTVATQMADAQLLFTVAQIEAADATFRASGKSVVFPGFFRAYVEGSDDPDAALEDQDQPLPKLQVGDIPQCKKVSPVGHETKAPSRYTEASLVQALEAEGIGRPSTYAAIVDTILSRKYARKQGNQLVPTFTAFATNNLLEQHFEKEVDLGFTAEMEGILDEIAVGNTQAVPFLKKWYLGDKGLEARVSEGLDKIDARAVSTLDVPKWQPYQVRVGRYGPYVDLDGVIAQLPDSVAPADFSATDLAKLIEAKENGDEVLGTHPIEGKPIYVRSGPYGTYVQLGEDSEDKKDKPKRAALPVGTTVEEVDIDLALKWLSLPKLLGTHPETGKNIVVNNGKFGPYVQHEKTFASIPKTEDLFEVNLGRALELIAAKNQKSAALKVLGVHPKTGESVEIWDGRYGMYVKHGKTNATLPKDSNWESIEFAEALALVAEKEANPTAKKKSVRKKK